jgi:hypothetical protein
MPAQDMLDVLHFYFEGDILGEEQVQKAKQHMRHTIYTQLYKRPYTWMVDGMTTQRGEFGTQEVGATGFHDQQPLTHKGYTPPTQFDPTAKRPFPMLDPVLE